MAYCKTVWLVDNDGICNIMTKKLILLSQFAEKVISFATVQEALLLLGDAKKEERILLPDVIFLDLMMPGLNGWDFLEAFLLIPKRQRTGCTLHLLSSSADAEEFLMARQHHEVCNVISKPLLQNDLEEIMQGYRHMGNAPGAGKAQQGGI